MLCTCALLSPVSTHREVTPDIFFRRNPEEIEREKREPAKSAVTKEEFQGEWDFPVPEFTATEPQVTDGSESAQVPSVPLHGFLRGLDCAAHCGRTDL